MVAGNGKEEPWLSEGATADDLPTFEDEVDAALSQCGACRVFISTQKQFAPNWSVFNIYLLM